MSATLNKRALVTLFAVVATELIGFGLIIPILPQIAYRFQTSGMMLGMLLASYSFAQFLAAPFLGQLSDKFGRKRLLIASKIGTVVGYIIMAYAQSYWMFLASRLLDGFTGGNISVARAYVTDVTTPEQRPRGMAVIGMSFGVGFLLGPALGGFLFSIGHSHHVPALVAGAFSFLALLLTIFFLKEPEKHQKIMTKSNIQLLSALTHLKSKPVLFLCLMQLGYMIIFSGFETTFSLFTFKYYGFSEHQNSWLFFYLALFGFLIQGGLARKSISRIKEVIVIGFILVGLGFAGLGMLPVFSLWVLGLVAIGISLVNTYLPSALSLLPAHNTEGALMGIYESMGSLARILGPLLAYVVMFQHIRMGYQVFGVVLISLAILFYFGFQRASSASVS